MKFSAAASVIALAAVTLAGCASHASNPQSRGADGPPIAIGEIATLTGNNAPIGAEDEAGATAAVQAINNAGGVLGRKLTLVVKDDATTPDQSVIDFQELAGQKVVGVIGSSFTLSALATIPLADRAQIPYISVAAGDQQLHPVRPYAFVAAPVASLSADRLLSYFKATGVRSVAMVYDKANGYTVAGQARMMADAASHGVRITDTEVFESTSTDFAPILTHLRASGAQAVVVWAVGAPAVLFAKQYQASGLRPRLAFSLAEASPFFIKPAGVAAENALVVASLGLVAGSLPDSPIKTLDNGIAAAYRARSGHGPSEFYFNSYDAVRLLAAAIAKAGSTDGPAVQAALQGLILQTAEGTVHLSGGDHLGLTAADLTVAQVSGGTLVPTAWARQQFATGTLGG